MNNGLSRARARRARAKERSERRPGAQLRRAAALAVVAVYLLALAELLVIFTPRLPRYTVGAVSHNTVIATIPFQTEDVEATRLKQLGAAESVPPAFRLDLSTVSRATGQLRTLIELAHTSDSDPAATDHLAKTVDEWGVNLSPDQLQAMFRQVDEEEFLAAFTQTLSQVVSAGIISAENRDSRLAGLASRGVVVLVSDALMTTARVDQLLTPEEAAQAAARQLLSRYRIRANVHELSALLLPWLKPNLQYDRQQTDKLREAARKEVAPVMRVVEPGTPLVSAGEVITPEIQQRLMKYERLLLQHEDGARRLRRHLGETALLLVMLVAVSGVTLICYPRLFESTRELLLAATAVTLALLLVAGALYWMHNRAGGWSGLLVATLPIGVAPLLLCVFVGGGAALPVGLWAAGVVAMMSGRPFDTVVAGLLVTAVAATSAREIHRRSRLLGVGLWMGLAAAVGCAAVALAEGVPPLRLPLPGMVSVAGGIVSAAVVLLLIPVLEAVFRMTTDIALLELSDLSHPLLKRLAVEAPGTYHHSLMVANLAEAAAREIGANPLLVRVAAYYHDIGKLTKPEFFAENLQRRANPHDGLSPSMSALVIASHVKEGVSLAQRYRLPPAILDAIQQHHGNSMISFFYQRARLQQEQSEGSVASRARPVEEKDYRYPGPRPRSREMALVALADAVEAASRTLEKPTAARIENMVNEIVEKKILDHQLDESQLTLSELAAIRRAFIFTLTNMLHERIQYPDHETERQKSAETASTGRATLKATRAGTGD